VPVGREPYFPARGLAALIATLDDAIISYRSIGGDAIIVVVGGRVLDAIAAPVGRPPLVGLDALNPLGPPGTQELRAAAVDRRLALALPSYWREIDRLPPIPARWVDAAGVIEAMIRPGRRGAIVLRSSNDVGIVLFDEAGLIAAYSQSRPEPGGLEALAPLLTDAGTVIHGRIADASGHGDRPPSSRVDDRVVAVPDSIERCRVEIVKVVQTTLRLHAEPVVELFRTAPGNAEGLLLAAEDVREMRLRLISPATMSSLAEQAEQIVRAASRSRGA
jgi:hypothetical protein